MSISYPVSRPVVCAGGLFWLAACVGSAHAVPPSGQTHASPDHKAVAAASRGAGRASEAEQAYRLALAATPDDAEAHAGLAYAWMDQGRIEQAVNHLTARLPKAPSRRDLPLLIALAELQDRRGEWLLAAGAYQDALKLEPGFRYPARGQVFALNNAGLPHLAKRLAESRPDAFNEEEMRRLAHNAAARTIIFGQAQQAAMDKPSRFATTDIALLQNAEVTRRFGDKPVTQFDRLIALRDRFRMRDAVGLYESLAADKTIIPSYVKAAAADAYLYLEQPDRARELYLEALKDAGQLETGEWIDMQVALMYANSEAERHDEAQALANQVLRTTPSMTDKGLRGMEAQNASYPRAALMVSLMLMYADRLEKAEQGLSEQRALAPFNSGIRSAWASLHTMRARPRAALEEFTLLQLDEPKSVDAAVGRADTLLSLNQFGDARAALAPLLTDYPEHKAVQNLTHRIDQHDRLQLKIDMTIGHGGSAAAAESVLDATLHSAPLKNSLGEHFRVFSHLSRSRGETGDASVTRTRAGAGIDYRARDIAIEAEINRAQGAANANGLALAMTKSLSDAWHLHAVVDSNLNDLPAAAFNNGVTAGVLKTGVTWIWNESRKAGGELSQTRYSDDNRRNAARLWWTERWIAGPALKVDSSLQLYGSTNSLRSAAYFNPQRDREASLSLSAEWLTWRRYHRSFRQLLSYTAGRYWQDDFAVAGLGDVRYEHEWRDDRNFSFRYGLGRGFHPYDGMREDRNYGFATFYWQIK